MAIRLLIEDDDTTSIVELTNRSYKLGRSSKADLRLNDSLISGIHCEITLTRNAVINIRDLESTNGTYINGSKIVSQKLFIGDILTLGKYSITIDINALSKKEYKEFYNSERTSIRFIDAGLKTKSIQHNIYEETKKNVVNKEESFKKDISFNIGTESLNKKEASPAPSLSSTKDDDIDQKTDIASNDCEFGFQHSSTSNTGIKHEDIVSETKSSNSLSLMENSTKNGYQSSGHTQFLKLSEKTGTKNRIKNKKISPPRPKRTKKVVKKKSLLDLILGLFKS